MLTQTLSITTCHMYETTARINAGCIHCCGNGPRRRQKALHLLRLPAFFLEPLGKRVHIRISTTGKGTDQVRNHILLLPRTAGRILKQFQKRIKGIEPRFAHEVQNPINAMLRRELELSTHKLRNQALRVTRFLHRQIIANTAGRANMLDPLQAGKLTQKISKLGLARLKMRTDRRPQTAFATTGLRIGRTSAAPHIRSRTSYVRDGTSPIRMLSQAARLIQQRTTAARTNTPALVQSKRAERAASGTSPMRRDAELEHLISRNLLFIRRVCASRKRQSIELIQLFGIQRSRRRCHHRAALPGRLNSIGTSLMHQPFNIYGGLHQQTGVSHNLLM